MSLPAVRGSRGAAPLLALALVAMLGLASATIDFANFQSESQIAATATALPKSAAKLVAPPAALEGDVRCKDPLEKSKNADAKAVKKTGVENICVQNCTYNVTQSANKVIVKGEDNCKNQPESTKASCYKAKSCVVKQCKEDGSCVTLAGTDSNLETALGRAAQIPKYFTDTPLMQTLLDQAKTDPDAALAQVKGLPPYLQDAFNQKVAEEQPSVKADMEKAYNDLNKYASSLNEEGYKKYADSLKTQNDNLAKLQTDLNKLKDDASGPNITGSVGCRTSACLDAAAGNYDGPGSDPVTGLYRDCSGSDCIAAAPDAAGKAILEKEGYVCESIGEDGFGCTKAKGAPTATRPPYTPSGPAGPGSTFTNPNGADKSGGGKMPDIGSLLKGLMGGGGQPAAGNGQPQAAGTCNPSVICGNNTLYSRNNQCVDTVMQQCQYGCNGTSCAQAPNQGANCPTAPVQPAPSGCTNGSWRPTYGGTNNACVSGWQCVGGSGSGIAAQISCQPQVADAGTTVTISYSCSAGSSTGAGFQTDGAQSGSTTTVLTYPSGTSNNVNYGLTCNNAGAVANAQCTVQVARPSIVLVANPKSVPSGAQTALGWITSGMQSCVISSPDIPAFTTQNANNSSVNGTATSPPLTSTSMFVLKCTTLGGSTREASTTVGVFAQ